MAKVQKYGVTKNGKSGEINRYGQSTNSTCCGAAKAGLNKLKNNEIKEGNITDLDYQMNTLEQILAKNKDRVLNSANQILKQPKSLMKPSTNKWMY